MGLFSSQISTKSMVPLCRQLATSYEAGIPIIRSLELVGEHGRDKKTQEVLRHMSEDIRQGASLGDAAAKQRKYLPHFFIALVSSGEYGGRLDVMLKDLADYFEDRLTMQRSIRSMMTYPIIQLALAWFIGSFALMLIRQVQGGFKASMSGRGQEFSFERFFAAYLTFQGVAVIIFLGLFIAAVILSRMGIFQWISGWFNYYVWPFRLVARKFALARFFRSMSLLVGSGMNIKHCIQNSAMVTLNPYVERDLLQAMPIVAEGATLTQAFTASKSLTPVSREMLHIGEQTGNLEGSLRKVSEYQFQEAAHAVNLVTKLFSILLMLIVGGVVGYIVISFYTGYLGMLDDI